MKRYSKAIGATVGAGLAWAVAFGAFSPEQAESFQAPLMGLLSVVGAYFAPANG